MDNSRLSLERAWAPAQSDIQAQKPNHKKSLLERLEWQARDYVTGPFRTRLSRFQHIVMGTEKWANRYLLAKDDELRAAAQTLRLQLRKTGFSDGLLEQCFALIREVASRTIGQRHYDAQLLGGRVMMEGMVAEMQTGEGKTLTATLPAATVALAGIPVHVVTVNDYLTARDSEEMRPVYTFLGLSVGCVIDGLSTDEKRHAYGADITYCSNKDVVFDYLRDRMALGVSQSNITLQTEMLYENDSRAKRLLQRGLHFAIVDEVDSVLIDDARTPLIISASVAAGGAVDFLHQAVEIASGLVEAVDYDLDRKKKQIYLTDKGKEEIAGKASSLGALWVGSIRREEVVRQALIAENLFIRNEQYIVSDGKVQIVDENTGRVMPDRSWEQGLHQMIELKENCELTDLRETQAKISYQTFFNRYQMLCGMSGTATEVKRELWNVYGLSVVNLPTHKPSARKKSQPVVVADDSQKWQRVLAAVKAIHQLGAPVLVGTKTVASSEILARFFEAEGLEYSLLNARQDQEEATIVANAGKRGKITIATNMAGRGTDIKLDPGVADLGGLHVVLTEKFEAGRIDRQFEGRCGRQGDPGMYLEILSMSDLMGTSFAYPAVAWVCKRIAVSRIRTILYYQLLKRGQRSMENLNAKIRRQTALSNDGQKDLLAFSGRFE
jgi:preprotein translocase subunit SecA